MAGTASSSPTPSDFLGTTEGQEAMILGSLIAALEHHGPRPGRIRHLLAQAQQRGMDPAKLYAQAIQGQSPGKPAPSYDEVKPDPAG